MAQVRKAQAVWEGDLLSGSGHVSSGTTQHFRDLAVTWGSRIEDPAGRTSPEELLAAAHASCYSMALSNILAKAGTPPERLEVSAEVTFDKLEPGWRVTTTTFRVRGRVPGGDAESFREAAESAKQNCPISQALKGNVEMTVEATLEG